MFLIDSNYLFGTIHWAIPDKKNNGVENIQFPEVLRNSMWNFQWLVNKKTMGIPETNKFMGGCLTFWSWNFMFL